MTPGQKRTAKRLLVAVGIFVALVVWLLYSEARGLAEGAAAQATISELVWLAWAHQPWVIWLVSVLVVGAAMFLAGHFFAQRATVYEDIRRGPSVRLTVDASQFEAALRKSQIDLTTLQAKAAHDALWAEDGDDERARAEHAEHLRADTRGGR